MPSLGADMDAGKVIEWLVKPGDVVHRGDIVAVVDTDKADVDVEIFEDGIVEALLVAPGEKVAVGTPLARIGPAGDGAAAGPMPAPPAPPARSEPPPAPRPPAAPAPGAVHSPLVRRLATERGVDLETLAGTGPEGTVTRADVEQALPAPAPAATGANAERPATPRARRLARELGVDLGTVTGTGPAGSVTGADLAAAAGPAAPVPSAARAEPSASPVRTDREASMRRAIASRMERANREIPHYYLETRVDLSRARAWLDTVNAQRSVDRRLIPAALLLKATAVAAREVPDLNGFWVDDAPRTAPDVNVGLVVSLRSGGLVAPAIHATDTMDLDELMRAMRDLVGRARAGRLRSSEMSDPTITVTNLGDQGVDKVFGVIFPPQLAIVGFGAIREEPWASGGMVGARPVVTVTLAGDHRATDGIVGARYLRAVDRLLQEPEEL